MTNVFLTSNDHCKLADFNLATRSTGETRSGDPYFTAPEIISGRGEYGTLADVYSFGVIVLCMFDGTRVTDTFLSGLQACFFLDVQLPSPDIEPLLLSTMAQDPTNRRSAEELRNAAFFKNVSWSEQRDACWRDGSAQRVCASRLSARPIRT